MRCSTLSSSFGILLRLGLLAPLLVACASSGGTTLDPAAADVRKQLTAEVEAYYADFSARDWVAMADHFHPGATISTIHLPKGATERELMLVTADEFIEKAPEGPGSQPIFEERMHSAQMHVRGNLAVVWARYTARFGNHESVLEWSGIDAFTLLRHDGRWRITALTFAPE